MTRRFAFPARAVALTLMLLLALPAAANDPGERRHGSAAVPEGVVVPDWAELSDEQRRHLARLEQDWDTLPASRRVLALERAERRARWEAMPPEQRERIRQGMRNYRDMTPAQRQRMRESLRVMRGLPEEQRQALAAQWRAMSPEQRRAWLQTGGPGISPAPEPGGD